MGYPTRSWAMLLIAGISITSAAFLSWPFMRLLVAGTIGGRK